MLGAVVLTAALAVAGLRRQFVVGWFRHVVGRLRHVAERVTDLRLPAMPRAPRGDAALANRSLSLMCQLAPAGLGTPGRWARR